MRGRGEPRRYGSPSRGSRSPRGGVVPQSLRAPTLPCGQGRVAALLERLPREPAAGGLRLVVEACVEEDRPHPARAQGLLVAREPGAAGEPVEREEPVEGPRRG